MSITWLPREMGLVVKCNGCGAKYHTGNISATKTRAWISKHDGWGRGLLKSTKTVAGTKRNDYCSSCMLGQHAALATQQAAEAERKQKRDEARKAKAAERAAAKKHKPAPKSFASNQPKARNRKRSAPASASTSSPSADSAPAPAS